MRPGSIDDVISAYRQALDELKEKERRVARLEGQRAELEQDISAIRIRVAELRETIVHDVKVDARVERTEPGF
jgi:hypothetical protein